MRHRTIFMMLAFAVAALLSVSTFSTNADARAGRGSSSGSRGSRSYSRPASTSTSQQAQRPSTPPPYQAAPQQAGGGFLRSMAGGIAGGLLGGMLFRSLGMAGGAGGGGGFPLFEIILLAGIGYLIYRYIKKKREQESANQGVYSINEPTQFPSYQQQPAVDYNASQEDVSAGISHIRQMDGSFDEQRFCDAAMDTFFKIQSAWMNRDLSTAAVMMTPQIRQTFQADIDKLLMEKRTNKLENIAVRNVDIVEAWQESGQDYITTLIYANLLDYTTDDTNGQVVQGSKTDPVKFEEYWTFTRPVGSNPWQLSAIDQK